MCLESSSDSPQVVSDIDLPLEDDGMNDGENDEMNDVEWTGFKIVGDNIDKTVHPRHMRSDRQTISLHYSMHIQ